jgi:coenzyme F420-0:L-glutamate ligase/coenzyme F420-1:gamma-L-glutamate ligase
VGAQLSIFGFAGIPEVAAGVDLPLMLMQAAERQGTPFLDRDVLVVTQKVVSKAEGRVLDAAEIVPSPFAETLAREYSKDARVVEAVLRESRRIVRMDRGVIIAESRLGFISANAGVDTSNLASSGQIALLPEDPDRWCRETRDALRRRVGVDVAVIMSDTFGRPWREGLTDVAIGLAGMSPVIDYRGQADPAGLVLKASVLAVADELAGAAELVIGKFSRMPAAIVRGYEYLPGDGRAVDLQRAPEKDLFR